MTFQELTAVTGGHMLQCRKDRPVHHLLIDSRKAIISETSLFFALKGDRHNGHQFIPSLYEQGVRQFVVDEKIGIQQMPEANVIQVSSVPLSLQQVAAFHRKQFQIPVVGIAGSNGKTIVKEWLSQALTPDHLVIKNPGSFNSQVGVPLSVWNILPHHTFGIFEAGISRPGEMENLEKVIQPSLGIFTNLGSAHDEGFPDRLSKAREKSKLFSHCQKVVYCKDHVIVDQVMNEQKLPSFTWSFSPGADVQVQVPNQDQLILTHDLDRFIINLPFRDPALQENALHVAAFLIQLGYPGEVIRQRLQSLSSIPMRLELKPGINRSLLIDDSYNNDLAGLQIGLDFLKNQQKSKKTIILSDVLQSGLPAKEWVQKIQEMIKAAGVKKWIGIGPVLSAHPHLLFEASLYMTTDDFLRELIPDQFADEVILIKGARPYGFEKIVRQLQGKVHGTVMEIDLDAMVQNLNAIRSRLTQGTKLMVMVKAFAYGSGSEQIANWLQFHRVDYLGVAYADEGIDLRKNNITVPIMVMNPSQESFPSLVEYRLEPEVYSIRILKALIDFLQGNPCPIHLKLDTGMHRLGLEEDQLEEAQLLLKNNPNVKVISVFSHLSGADESDHDDFSAMQAAAFVRMAGKVADFLGYQPIRHLLNSPGILRLPQYQFDMVRLGIGLYGVDPTEDGRSRLLPVSTLKSIISQIKRIKAGETIGYGRKGKAARDMMLATVAIGYADGYSRSFSQGKGKMLIRGKLAPVMGNVCMDMTMVDITGIDTFEGDEVIIFGRDLPIREVARWINTIPYELLTQTSERVKRVFIADSI